MELEPITSLKQAWKTVSTVCVAETRRRGKQLPWHTGQKPRFAPSYRYCSRESSGENETLSKQWNAFLMCATPLALLSTQPHRLMVTAGSRLAKTRRCNVSVCPPNVCSNFGSFIDHSLTVFSKLHNNTWTHNQCGLPMWGETLILLSTRAAPSYRDCWSQLGVDWRKRNASNKNGYYTARLFLLCRSPKGFLNNSRHRH